jgi:hypothetical protein
MSRCGHVVKSENFTVQKRLLSLVSWFAKSARIKEKGDVGNNGRCAIHRTVMICLVGFQPLEDNLKGLSLGLLDGFILVLSNDSKACNSSVS